MRIICSSCQKPMSVDEAKLPMREVSFPCPSCKAKVTVDRRALEPEAAPPAPPAIEPEPEDDGLGAKALLVGQETPALRQAARAIGFQPVHFPAVEACRDFFLQEQPRVVFLNPAQLTPPPLQDFQILTSVGVVERRKGFFILVADNLKTFDGTAAFLYGVNLVLASRDLGSIQRIYAEADAYHQRLYQSFRAVAEQRGA